MFNYSAKEMQTIFRNDRLSVEFYPGANENASKLAYIFSPLMNKQLTGNLYGGELLCRNGFDVISFKSLENNWFQSVPKQTLSELKAFSDKRQYSKIVGYGGSLGGYAAIAFSKLLDMGTVLAISPQYSTKEYYDKRWLQFVSGVNFQYEINPYCINPSCDYFFLYDDLDRDKYHIESLSKIIEPTKFHATIVSGSGHPTTHHLDAIGVLKDVAVSVLDCQSLDGIDLNKPLPLKRDPRFSKETYSSKVGPNDLCPCGRIDPQTNKQKKYKKCCI